MQLASATALVLSAWLLLCSLVCSPACAQPATPLSGYSLTVASQPVNLSQTPLKMKGDVLMLPLRPIAERMLAELEIDPSARTVRIIRADDRQEVIADTRTGQLMMSGFPQGPDSDIALIDFTPDKEMAPQALVEKLFNVFVAVEPEKRTIAVNPASGAFASALEEYKAEQLQAAANKHFTIPKYRLNAVQYDSLITSNTATRNGHMSTLRTSSQFGPLVANTYQTYLGGSEGPGFRYSIGGFDILAPRGWSFKGGDYALRTGSPFAGGINRGFIGEKSWGKVTRVGVSVGNLQTRLRNVGLTYQRPLFLRTEGLLFALLDTDDFKDRPWMKNSRFWRNHRLIAGAGMGGFKDFNNPQFFGEGLMTYGYLRDSISRFGGRLKVNTEVDAAASYAKRDNEPGGALKPGGALLVRNSTQLFNKITFSSLMNVGSPRWSTLDITNSYRNQFFASEGVQVGLLKGLTVFGTGAVSRPVQGDPTLTKIWAGGGTMNFLPGYLPEISFTSNVTTKKATPTQYFNTAFFNYVVPYLRTNVSGLWLFSNTGNKQSFQSTFSLNTKTVLPKNITVYTNRQWSHPETKASQYNIDTGTLFGQLIKFNAGVGRTISPNLTVNNFLVGANVFVPWIGQRANVQFSRYGDSYQFALGLNGFFGRRDVALSAFQTPTRIVPLTGALSGRFYIDNDLSQTYDPKVDRPLVGLRVIANNRVIGVTDSQGAYHAKELIRGFMTVTTDASSIPATLAFITPTQQDVFILPSKTRVVDFRFGKLARLEGSIKSDPPNPDAWLKDIRVFIDGTDRDTLTDETGHYQITDVVPGKYAVKIDPDYVPESETLVVGEQQITLPPGSRLKNVDFTVRPKTADVIEKRFGN